MFDDNTVVPEGTTPEAETPEVTPEATPEAAPAPEAETPEATA